jgi:polysaccharide pyruvyl transferase CsaB
VAKVLLLGYYGYGNSGDEAVLLTIAQSLAKEGHSPGVLTSSKEATERLLSPTPVRTFSRMSLGGVLQGILWSDLLVLGGGSLLQDVTGPMSLRYYIAIIQLAKLFGKPYVFFAQGLGPFIRKGSRQKVGRVAKGAKLLSVRDPKSKEFLEELGLDSVLVADPVWSLAPEIVESQIEAPYLLFALRPWQGREGELVEALKYVRSRTELPFVFLAMHPEFDLPLARHLAAEVGGQVAQSGELPELLGYFAGARAVCAMRLHALIFGALLGKKLVAISYDPKVDILVEELGIRGLALEGELGRRLEEALSGAIAPDEKKVHALRERAEAGLDLLLRLGRELDGEN